MVTNYVSLTINETYDINTLKDKMAVIGIRTPSPGLVSKYIDPRQFKKIKFHSCSIRLASASQLPVDPLGVGFEAGQIAPQDIMNPLLFKAVSGESFSAVLDCIYNATEIRANPDFYYEGSLNVKHVEGSSDVPTGMTPEGTDFTASSYDIYYTLLHDGTFRPAHPQQGLVVNHLVPLVRDMHSTAPLSCRLGNPQNKWLTSGAAFGAGNLAFPRPAPLAESDDIGFVWTDLDGYNNSNESAFNFFMSGNTRPMPSFDTQVALGMDNQSAWPFTYVGCLVVPPYKMASLYMRMVVSWRITLSEFIPIFKRGVRGDTDPNWLYADMIQVPVSPEAAKVSEGLQVKTDLLEGSDVEGINYIGSSMT